MIRRFVERELRAWLKSADYRPIVLAGAPLTGKTTLVREFSRHEGRSLREINLAQHRAALGQVFASRDIGAICDALSKIAGASVDAPDSMLLLDNIQACPEAFDALPDFNTRREALPVFAVSSGIDVSRVPEHFATPLFIGPLSFGEFLQAVDAALVPFFEDLADGRTIPEAAHHRLFERLRAYLLVGGMPQAVEAYASTMSFERAHEAHGLIYKTLRERVSHLAEPGKLRTALRALLLKTPNHMDFPFRPEEVVRKGTPPEVVSEALRIFHGLGFVVPCEARSCETPQLFPPGSSFDVLAYGWKCFYFDTGLVSYLCGIDPAALATLTDMRLVDNCPLAEQFAAQQLFFRTGVFFRQPRLACWNGDPDINFVASTRQGVVPIVIRATLYDGQEDSEPLLRARRGSLAVRLCASLPEQDSFQPDRRNDPARRCLLQSVPLYMAERLFAEEQ